MKEYAEQGYTQAVLVDLSKYFDKTVMLHIWKPYVEMAEELRYTERHKRYYKMRKENNERVFADTKEKHGMIP